jgi:hypothetical protein
MASRNPTRMAAAGSNALQGQRLPRALHPSGRHHHVPQGRAGLPAGPPRNRQVRPKTAKSTRVVGIPTFAADAVRREPAQSRHIARPLRDQRHRSGYGGKIRARATGLRGHGVLARIQGLELDARVLSQGKAAVAVCAAATAHELQSTSEGVAPLEAWLRSIVASQERFPL